MYSASKIPGCFYIVSLKKNWFNSIISMLKALKYRQMFIFKINLHTVYCLVSNTIRTIFFTSHLLYKLIVKYKFIVVCPFHIVLMIN